MNTQPTTPLSIEREQEIRESIPTVYGPPWTVHPDMEADVWRVMYATDNPLAGLVAEVPDYGAHLAEFIAEARAAVPELLAEIDRLRGELATALRPDTPRLCECGHSNLAHTVPAPHSCFAHGQTCPCPTYRQLPHDEAVAQLERNRQAATERTAAVPAVEAGAEQPAACRKCKTPFDPADTRHDGHAREGITSFCRRCVDRCHSTEIADHCCVICGA